MNCTQFRKYAGAFADGELDIQLNLEALEHLNMCPDCTSRVDEITSLRSALERSWSGHRAPTYLRERVQQLLEKEIYTAVPVTAQVAPEADPHVPVVRRTSRWLLPVSIAAAVLVAVTAWQYRPRADLGSGAITIMATRTAADAAMVHRHCTTTRRLNHHDPSLSRKFDQLALQMSDRMNYRVIAPDFSSDGFELIGADVCLMGGRKSAHVLYERPQEGVALSVFSTKHIPELHPDGVTALGDTGVFVRKVGNLTVAAWHEDEQTYTFCSELSEMPLLRIVRHIRVAARARNSQTMALLAFSGGRLPH